MSRSYRKFLSQQHNEFEPPDWSLFRNNEKMCIREEYNNPEIGDVIFPEYYGSRKFSWFCSKRYYYPKKSIRDTYFTEIRNILNGYIENYYWIYKDYQQSFFEAFNNIKNKVSPDGKKSCFDWLNTRTAREIVKKWERDPLDVLYYLTKSGAIEKAVRAECKRITKK